MLLLFLFSPPFTQEQKADGSQEKKRKRLKEKGGQADQRSVYKYDLKKDVGFTEEQVSQLINKVMSIWEHNKEHDGIISEIDGAFQLNNLDASWASALMKLIRFPSGYYNFLSCSHFFAVTSWEKNLI